MQPAGPEPVPLQAVDGPVLGASLIGVASKVKQNSLLVHQGKDTYFEWEFIWNPLLGGGLGGSTPTAGGVPTGAAPTGAGTEAGDVPPVGATGAPGLGPQPGPPGFGPGRGAGARGPGMPGMPGVGRQ
jgi:hypothetical protein